LALGQVQEPVLVPEPVPVLVPEPVLHKHQPTQSLM
jgi:hypothetical protein